MAEFCEGGLWPAVQSFVIFLATNVVTHAASSHFPAGANSTYKVYIISGALITPVSMGCHAFHLIGRWWTRLWFRVQQEPKFTSKVLCAVKVAVGGDGLEDAAMAGALAISIPSQFLAVVPGSWDILMPYQQLDSFDHVALSNGWISGPGPTLRGSHVYLLPPTVRLRTRRNYRIATTSPVLSQIIAILQLFLGSRQLYIHYSGSIKASGLSSPYLVVLPYLLMTLLNFVANALIPSYPSVVVLPSVNVDEATGDRDDGIRQLEASSDETLNREFLRWIKRHYPYLEISDSAVSKRWRMSRILSCLFLVSLMTLMLGLLTRFVGVTSKAAWFLTWAYGMSALPLLVHALERLANVMESDSLILGLLRNLVFLVVLAVVGGISVIAVSVLEDMCDRDWSIPLSRWILIGSMSCLIVGLVAFLALRFGASVL